MIELEATIDDGAIDKDTMLEDGLLDNAAMLLGWTILLNVERGLTENGKSPIQLPKPL
jgi:hypothetical protein